MSEWRVIVSETHTYELTVDADDFGSAIDAAEQARVEGKGKRRSKTPWRTMPVVSRIKN